MFIQEGAVRLSGGELMDLGGLDATTCGSFHGLPPSWNVFGAMTAAMASLQAGDVILLEQQWDYSGTAKPGRYIPIEWWNSTTGLGPQSNAACFAIQTAVANGIHVVEAGGNGNVDTSTMACARASPATDRGSTCRAGARTS